VICNSEVTRRDVIEKVGVDPSRTTMVYYGTDPEQFHPPQPAERIAFRKRLQWPSDQPVGLFIGALGDRRKGFDTLFSAWKTLCTETSWDALLVVIGSGHELPAWETRARAAGLTNRIHFLGFRTDVSSLLQAADALIHPARYEAYGLGVHEAFCCGIPAVVSASAGIAERYPADLKGLLIPDPESPAELANRLKCWRAQSGSFAASVRSLSDQLRSRTWADMASDIRAAVLSR
jgi:glycosyltransferase involved in cell wall biosynthesis